jgi:hypothetical protein
MLDHDDQSYKLIARVFDGQKEGLTRDDILDNITLYWLTKDSGLLGSPVLGKQACLFCPKHVMIPTAVSAFPNEIYTAPESWTKMAYPNSFIIIK